MSKFEKIYQDGKPTESDLPREKHLTIEKPDYCCEMVYKPPIDQPDLLDKKTIEKVEVKKPLRRLKKTHLKSKK